MSLSEDPVNAIPAATQLRRSRRRWRLAAFAALAVAIVALTARLVIAANGAGEDHIARIVVSGMITTDALRNEVLAELAESERVKAVIVAINSPGGTTAGGEELYETIGKLRQVKPVAATIDELGASAAYMTAIAADRIYSRRLSIVGSIGVFMQHVDAGKLLDTIGIDFDKVQTGPLKAEPDVDEPMVGEVRQSLQALVDDSFEWFVDIVAERRDLDRAETLRIADGRIMTGRMALETGLIDAVGGEAEAIAWLESDKNIEKDLPVITHYPLPESDFERFARYLGSRIQAMIGIGPQSAMALDGLVSLWQASPTN